MKLKMLLLFGVVFSLLSLTYWSDNDSCESYFPLNKGSKRVYNEYDKKDKLESISTMEVRDVKHLEGKVEYVLDVKSESAKPKKDEQPFKKTLYYFCENGVLSVDMSDLVPEEYKDMDVEVTQKELQIPSKLEKGMALKDAELNILISGMQMMHVDIVDRKVEGFESITTPAGTFNCALITYTSKSKFAFMTVEAKSKTWLSPEVGEVMYEGYDKNGKKMNSKKLVEFVNGK
ncbi:MAG: TapB family protein [Putridiphycobacter sp.]